MIRFQPSLLSFLVLAACGAPSVDEVKTTAQNLSTLVEEGYQAVEDSTNRSDAITRLYAALNITQRDLGREPLTRPTVPAWMGSQATIDTYKRFLMDCVFTSDNVESQGGGSVTFLVKGKTICEDPSTPSPDPTYVATCAKTYDDMQLRIVASGNPASTVNLDIVLGKGKHTVATVIIEKDRALELQYHYAGYSKWLQDQYPQAAGGSPYAGFYGISLEGDFSVRVEKLGPKDFELTYNVLTDIKYSSNSTGYVGPYAPHGSYTMEARSPMYRLRFDGARGVHEAKIDVGPTHYKDVWGYFLPTPDGGVADMTPLEGTMQGFTLELTTDAAPVIASGSLSFGTAPSTLMYGNTEVVSFGLARPVSFTVDDDNADGRLRFDFSEIDATLAMHLGRVPRLTVDPAWADETYRVRFNGGGQAMKLAAAQSQLGFKVISGTFGLEAQNASRSVTASGGLCLVSREMPADSLPLGALAAVPCP